MDDDLIRLILQPEDDETIENAVKRRARKYVLEDVRAALLTPKGASLIEHATKLVDDLTATRVELAARSEAFDSAVAKIRRLEAELRAERERAKPTAVVLTAPFVYASGQDIRQPEADRIRLAMGHGLHADGDAVAQSVERAARVHARLRDILGS